MVSAVAGGEAHFGPEIARRLMGFFSAPKPAARRGLPELTVREREVLDLMAQGLGTPEIAPAST